VNKENTMKNKTETPRVWEYDPDTWHTYGPDDPRVRGSLRLAGGNEDSPQINVEADTLEEVNEIRRHIAAAEGGAM
jgi:hypothetical protein